VVEAGEPPSPCAPLPEPSEASALFDAFFRAHAQGRIDPELVDAHGGPVPQTPIATELVCPRSLAVREELSPGRRLVALQVSAGSTERDVVETQVVVTRQGGAARIEVESLARLRGDLQAFLLRRLLRDHAEIELLAAIDVPFEDDLPGPEGVSPRRRAREHHNLRLAFARQSTGTVLCLLDARADSTSTRSWCWRDDDRIDRVVAGEPMIVDETVQVQLVLVPVAPARRAEVVEVRLPSVEARSVGVVTVRPAPIVAAWEEGRAREGVVLVGRVAPRPGAWAALPAVDAPPPWIAVLAAVPWLRATPVPSPSDLPATSITSDLGETRRWLAVHTPTGWAFSDALDRPGPDGMTSWDGVEPAPDGTILARSSDFGAGHGTARRHTLRADGERLVQEGVAVIRTLGDGVE